MLSAFSHSVDGVEESRRKMTEMISLVTYHEVKRFTKERQRQSLAKYETKRSTPNDSYVRPARPQADIVELTFGPACEPESIGA